MSGQRRAWSIRSNANSLCLTPKNESSVLESFFPILFIYFSKSTKRKCPFLELLQIHLPRSAIVWVFLLYLLEALNSIATFSSEKEPLSRKKAGDLPTNRNWQKLTFLFLIVTPVIVLSSSFLRGLGRAVFSVLWSTLSLLVFITIR